MVTPTNALLIIRPLPMSIRNTDIANFLANLVPVRTRGRNRRHLAQRPVSPSCHDEPTEEVKIIDIGGARRHRFSDCADETDDIDEDTADVGRVATPVEAEGEVVRGVFLGAVQVFDLVVTFADDVVVTYNDAGDGGEEDGVGAEVGGEVVGG